MTRQTQTHKPIYTVLVPGWLDTERTLSRLRIYLELAGHKTVTCSPQPSDGSVAIRCLAEQLAAYIDESFGADEPVNLFGFSMGGMIGRVYLQQMEGWRRVGKFVTVASPHRGTQTARLFSREAILQMRPDSELIRQLNRDLSPLERVQFTSVWSPFDLTIVPSSSSILPVGRTRRIWSPAHGIMMYDPNVMRTVSELLAE
jgi:triacylglycerol lipase